MRRLILTCLALVLALTAPAAARVFQTADKTYDLKARPVDIAGSETGTTFILTDDGKVTVIKKSGEKGEIEVGKAFDRIDTNASGSKIFLSSSTGRQAKSVFVDFAQEINTDGAPFLGPEDAPVVMVVFSDFQ